jgi:hypothetical protein
MVNFLSKFEEFSAGLVDSLAYVVYETKPMH